MKILYETEIVDTKNYDRVKYYNMGSTSKPKFSVYIERGLGLIDKRIASFTKEEYAKKFMEDFLNAWLKEELCFDVNKWINENVTQ